MRPEPSDSEQLDDGYDASEGPPQAGESMALADIFDTAEDDGESLSVDVDDLGAHALREAAQQGDARLPTELDEDMLTPSERSALLASEESTREPAAVDLTESTIRDGSIFDQPGSEELGQVRRPLLKTNEVDATLDRNERARKARKARR